MKSNMNTCHLVLISDFYDMIDKGDKTVEYRENKRFWVKRIWGKDYVTFHRGYTSETMTFKIKFVNWTRDTIEIHLGERIK